SELAATIQRAETDALTGLLNRRAYDEKLQQAYRRAVRQKNEALSLILFDLDYFKQINDEFGHQYGDAYLNKMAQAMLGVIRADVDFAFRFGGDEFAVLLFCDARIACRKALDVLAAMNGKVSIGIACLAPGNANPPALEDFIHSADDALYEAKRAGRGRVVVNGCTPPAGIGCVQFCPRQEAV
ncbi:MAG: GGDEF domain-containing protein, partial [Nitrosomonadales bacterium]